MSEKCCTISTTGDKIKIEISRKGAEEACSCLSINIDGKEMDCGDIMQKMSECCPDDSSKEKK